MWGNDKMKLKANEELWGTVQTKTGNKYSIIFNLKTKRYTLYKKNGESEEKILSSDSSVKLLNYVV